MKTKLIGLLTISIFALVATSLLPTSINAQIGQLRYQNRYSKSQVGDILKRLESSSKRFRQDFDRALDRSRINGSSTEDQYNQFVKDYTRSLENTRKQFDRNKSWWLVRDEVQDTISRASSVNNIINNLSFRRDIERQWNTMRNDLNGLADTFDLPGLNGGGWNGGGQWNGGNGGGWNGSGEMSSPPNWAVGTFYSTNGTKISLTLEASGRATVVNAGQTYYGTYNRGNLWLNGDSSNVRRNGNGIETYNRNTGQTTVYSRSGWGGNGGNGGGWNGSGEMSSPPNWAVGTFYSTNGTNISLTLDASGRATVVNAGQTYYGTYNRGNLWLNGDSSNVRRNGNGIETYNRNTGQTTVYSRSGWGGHNGGWNGSGNMSSPPNWAVGTFYSTNGPDITLTLNNNGQVTAFVNGQTYYGTFYNGAISLNGDVSTVSRNGSGLRTYNSSTGQTTNYRKR